MRNRPFKQNKTKSASKAGLCVFCRSRLNDPARYGKLFIRKNVSLHYFCALFASGLAQNGKFYQGVQGFLIKDILEEIKRGQKLKCVYCKQGGATIGCINIRCRKVFHLNCGQENDVLTQFFGSFKSFCKRHRPVQDNSKFSCKDTIMCCICIDKIDCSDNFNVLKCPCCASAWFHRNCIQQYAHNSGYFFKCPLCNNADIFRKEMHQYGIYIPQQDASWELTENAFEELILRPECSAENCSCPDGRSADKKNSIWLLRVCHECGGNALHIGCEESPTYDRKTWRCHDCIKILKRIRERNDNNLPTPQICNGGTEISSSIDVGTSSEYPKITNTETVPLQLFSSTSMMGTSALSTDTKNYELSCANLIDKSSAEVQKTEFHSSVKLNNKVEEHVILFDDNTDEFVDICELDPKSVRENPNQMSGTATSNHLTNLENEDEEIDVESAEINGISDMTKFEIPTIEMN